MRLTTRRSRFLYVSQTKFIKNAFEQICNSATNSKKLKIQHEHRAESCERKLVGDARFSVGSNGGIDSRKDCAWGGTQSLVLRVIVLILDLHVLIEVCIYMMGNCLLLLQHEDEGRDIALIDEKESFM